MWKRMEINKEDITIEDLLWNQDLIFELTLREIEKAVTRGATLEEISEISGIPLDELTTEERGLESRGAMEMLSSQEEVWEMPKRECRNESMKSTALRMLAAGKYILDEIAEISGLSLDEVKKLQMQQKA